MTRSGTQAHGAPAPFEERLEILSEELELAVKWRRPCMVLVVYSSEYVRAEVEAALENRLIDLGQKSIHLSVKNRDPQRVPADPGQGRPEATEEGAREQSHGVQRSAAPTAATASAVGVPRRRQLVRRTPGAQEAAR